MAGFSLVREAKAKASNTRRATCLRSETITPRAWAQCSPSPSALRESGVGGFWLAMGLAMLWAARKIETETTLFRALWAAIFMGGIGRVISMFAVAPPPAPFVAFTVLELAGAPFFIWWQARISRS